LRRKIKCPISHALKHFQVAIEALGAPRGGRKERERYMRKNIGSWRSVLIVGAVVLGGLILIAETAKAANGRPDSIEVELACPTAIAAGGGLLSITLTMRNKTSVTKTVTKSGIVVHLGNLNLLGPFFVPLSVSLAPFQTKVVPYLSTSFPAGAAPPGTFSGVNVFVMDSANQISGNGSCFIQIQ
jgi:hypothetical protein